VTPALASILVALALAAAGESRAAGAPAAATESMLDVPYLPQTPALCGGAAAAMVFRYWGDRHADVQQFAEYVDSRAGGIADDVLIDAIRRRHWRTEHTRGSIDALRARLAARQPVILLLADRPRRYHYVVAVGAGASHIYLHDPTWGPARKYRDAELTRLWQPSNFWSLIVLPGDQQPADPPRTDVAPAEARTECARLLDDAVDEIRRRGFSSADRLLQDVRDRCPRDAAPIAELAGIRFAQQRTNDAEQLARDALKIDPHSAYAWDVLGSARFVRNDSRGALEAWNHIGKPRLDSVQIEGLTRTRYALVAESLHLSANTVLSASAYRAAEHRLRQLPTRMTARIGYRPEDDGFATVKVVIVERPTRPRGLVQWLGTAGRATANRELRATVPGWTGQGEAWSAAWRWWNDRPRVAFSFAAPRALGLPGVARVEASWEKQTYRLASDKALIQETQLHAGLALTDWLAANTRYEIGAGVDSWNHVQRTGSIGGLLEQRLFKDRVAVTASSRFWTPTASASAFGSLSLAASIESSGERRGLVQTIDAGLETATEAAPLALWSGAGEGHARAPLLRAHALLVDDVVSGVVFGRRTAHLTAETTRWMNRPTLAKIGMAAFVDVARSSRGLTPRASRTYTDVGVGVRVAMLGDEGVLRADYGHGIRDGQKAFSVAWQVTNRR
jgi:hypothetical protein